MARRGSTQRVLAGQADARRAASGRGRTGGGTGPGGRRRGPTVLGPERRHGVTSYWDRSQWPIHALYFLSPLLVVYTLGTLGLDGLRGDDADRLPPIYAEKLLSRLFALVNLDHTWMPALLVVVLLVVFHVLRRDPWRPELKLYPLMLGESILYALPLFLLSTAAAAAMGSTAQAVAASSPGAAVVLASGFGDQGLGGIGWSAGLLLAIGAGIYEELMFRVLVITGLHVLFRDVLAFPVRTANWIAIVGAAVLFAAYHFAGGGGWHVPLFVFYAVAGLYFGVIYATRGFGVVVATHAVYDILAIATHLEV